MSTPRQLPLVLAILVLTAAAAGALLWPRPSLATRSERGVLSAASTACEPARDHAAGDFERTVDSGGLTREFLLHVPPSYTGIEAVPLVLNIHGLGMYAAQQAEYSGLPAKADEAGFILVSPQGTVSDLLHMRQWNFSTLLPDAPDDVAFVADLLDSLESQLCIDPTRIYSTGMSNGAQMSVRLACDLSGRIAAVAPVAAVYYPPWSPLDMAAEPDCLSARPVPVIAFHGTDDTIIPFEGGDLGLDFSFRLRNIEDEVMPDWANHNGCASGPHGQQVTENVRLVRYEDCDQGATPELYVVDGGGHVWPGAEDFPDPDVADEIDANGLMWEFFQAHPFIVLPGDADCGGGIDSIDAVLVLQLDAGMDARQTCRVNADVNKDGAANSIDGALILQYDAGLIDALPA